VTGVARWLPPFAVAALVLGVGLICAVAGTTLGYDYQAYVGAADRILAGRPLYDTAVSVAGGFAIFLYPPPFALAMLPFALLPDGVGLVAWLGLLVAAFVAGVAILPVRLEVRWALVLLAGVSWPFLYSIKLGQVGPLLFLTFAAAWRSANSRRPVELGAAMAAGALIKLQPAILFGWAAATGRWRSVLVGLGIAIAVSAVSAAVLGIEPWGHYVDLLRRVSTPVTTPHNFTPGAIAYQAGVPEASATILQFLAMAGAAALAVLAWFRLDSEASLAVTVVASQLLSPLLWDHYAMLLLIPTALLLERRHWWAVAIPLAGWLPSLAYPATFAIALVGPFLASRGRPHEMPRGAHLLRSEA
jgi:alpha-1,2-mannosyltransferase